MKGRYVTAQIRMACQSKPPKARTDIHAELMETISERRRIMASLERRAQAALVVLTYLKAA